MSKVKKKLINLNDKTTNHEKFIKLCNDILPNLNSFSLKNSINVLNSIKIICNNENAPLVATAIYIKLSNDFKNNKILNNDNLQKYLNDIIKPKIFQLENKQDINNLSYNICKEILGSFKENKCKLTEKEAFNFLRKKCFINNAPSRCSILLLETFAELIKDEINVSTIDHLMFNSFIRRIKNGIEALNDEDTITQINMLKNMLYDHKLNKNNIYVTSYNSKKTSEQFSELPICKLKILSDKLWIPREIINNLDISFTADARNEKIKTNSWFRANKNLKINDEQKNVYADLLKEKTELEKQLIEIIDEDDLEELLNDINKNNLKQFDPKEIKKNNKKKKPKKKKKKNNTAIDPTKKACKYIVTTNKNQDGLIHGRFCGNICLENKETCRWHIDEEKKDYDVFDNIICQHIITQKSKGESRKGMICGEFTNDSFNPKYCKKHIKRHPEELKDDKTLETTERSFKVRFYPTKEQRKKLACFFGDARFTYNKCVENKEGYDKNIKNKYTTQLTINNKFLANTPFDIRNFEIDEYKKNLKNSLDAYNKKVERDTYCKENYPNYKPKNIKKPIMTFKTKYDSQSIGISKDAVKIKNKEMTIYEQKFSKTPIKFISRSKKDKKLNKILESTLCHDIKIIKTITDKYYICFMEDVEKQKIKEVKKATTVDTGGRTIATTYSDNESNEYGTDMNELIGEMIKEKTRLRKIYDIEIIKVKNKTRDQKKKIKSYWVARKNYRLYNEKIINKINDCHYKIINELVKDSTLIMIPRLNTAKIVENNKNPTFLKKNMHKKAKQILNIERHGKFIQRLEEKGETTGTNVRIISEFMTSQTCGRCFNTCKFNGKTYDCKMCGIVIDRDINAGRNMYIQQSGILYQRNQQLTELLLNKQK